MLKNTIKNTINYFIPITLCEYKYKSYIFSMYQSIYCCELFINFYLIFSPILDDIYFFLYIITSELMICCINHIFLITRICMIKVRYRVIDATTIIETCDMYTHETNQ